MSILRTNHLKNKQTNKQIPSYKKPSNPGTKLSGGVAPTSSWKDEGYFKGTWKCGRPVLSGAGQFKISLEYRHSRCLTLEGSGDFAPGK